MMKDFEEVIKKNLPQQVGEQLRVELEELAKLRGTVVKQDDTIKNQLTELTGLRALKHDAEQIKVKQNELEKKAAEISKQETILSVKQEALKERNNDIYNLVSNLTRNTEFRRTYYETNNDLSGGYTDEHGQWRNPKNETKSVTETKEEI